MIAGAWPRRFTHLYRSANPASLAAATISSPGDRPDSPEYEMRDLKAAAAPRPVFSFAARFAAAGVLVIAAAGAAIDAHAQGMGMAGHGQGHGGPGMMMFGASPEHVDRMLDGLGVSDAQRAQIKQIVVAAATDLKAQREAGRALHEQGMQIFAAPTVDAAAAESLRQQMLAQHDQASKRMLQAMLDVSKVLTPAQRAKMAERMKQRQAVMQERMQREQREHGPRPQK
jgi:Spy/CpxP family protein refolding chaperone